MSVVQRAATIDAAPDHVWRYLADLRNWEQWEPDIVEVLSVDGGLRDGGRLRARMKPRLRATIAFTEVEPPRRFVCHTTLLAGLLAARAVFELDPARGGSATDLSYAFRMGGPVGVVIRTFNPQKVIAGPETGLSNLVALVPASVAQ